MPIEAENSPNRLSSFSTPALFTPQLLMDAAILGQHVLARTNRPSEQPIFEIALLEFTNCGPIRETGRVRQATRRSGAQVLFWLVLAAVVIYVWVR